jgi:hypothetical protein
MLGYALRGELGDLATLLRAEGSDVLPAAIPLFLLASAYIAIRGPGHRPALRDREPAADLLPPGEGVVGVPRPDLGAAQAADRTSLTVLPALILRANPSRSPRPGT